MRVTLSETVHLPAGIQAHGVGGRGSGREGVGR